MSDCSIPDCYVKGLHQHQVTTGNQGEKMTAEQIAKRVAEDYYEEDGEFISDLLIRDIKSAEEAAVRKAVIESFGPEYRKVESEGFQRGQREMRERAEKDIESREIMPSDIVANFNTIFIWIAERIRAISIDIRERK
jgi:hypothetical protein